MEIETREEEAAVTLIQLRYLITIAETNSLNKAAEQLYVSQPSLTSAMKELEKELGIILFYRSGRGVTLTNDGTEFLLYAKQIYSQYESVMEKYGLLLQAKKLLIKSLKSKVINSLKSWEDLIHVYI